VPSGSTSAKAQRRTRCSRLIASSAAGLAARRANAEARAVASAAAASSASTASAPGHSTYTGSGADASRAADSTASSGAQQGAPGVYARARTTCVVACASSGRATYALAACDAHPAVGQRGLDERHRGEGSPLLVRVLQDDNAAHRVQRKGGQAGAHAVQRARAVAARAQRCAKQTLRQRRQGSAATRGNALRRDSAGGSHGSQSSDSGAAHASPSSIADAKASGARTQAGAVVTWRWRVAPVKTLRWPAEHCDALRDAWPAAARRFAAGSAVQRSTGACVCCGAQQDVLMSRRVCLRRVLLSRGRSHRRRSPVRLSWRVQRTRSP
jgi:hypothetical protein